MAADFLAVLRPRANHDDPTEDQMAKATVPRNNDQNGQVGLRPLGAAAVRLLSPDLPGLANAHGRGGGR
jgi:hypothetical protein